MMDGYLRFIDPDDYRAFLDATYFGLGPAVPIMSTAFGDLVTLKEGEYIGIVQYKKGTSHIMMRTFRMFLRCLESEHFLEEFFDLERYREARALLPMPGPDECYGYVPLLALGGGDDARNLQVVKMREHLLIISQVIGPIGA